MNHAPMRVATQRGITPPAPGQDKEEPEFRDEDDIPSSGNDRGYASDDKPQREDGETSERGERD